VRAELYNALCLQPGALDAFGSAALSRLVVGLVDRSNAVRTAAAAAVEVWCKRVGGPLNLLSRCELSEDEMLGEAIAGALAVRYPEESAAVAKEWLSNSAAAAAKRQSTKGKAVSSTATRPPASLLGRFALTTMGEDSRDEVLDVPMLLQRAKEVLETSQAVGAEEKVTKDCDFQLRQLLQVIAVVDVCDESIRRSVEEFAEAILLKTPIFTTNPSAASSANAAKRSCSAVDLAVVILRRCMGLPRAVQVRTKKHQALENKFSTRMVLLMSDLCQPYEGGGGSGDAEAEGSAGGSFAGRLSRQLEKINSAIEERRAKRAEFQAKKKKAIAEEDFIACQELKDVFKRNEEELTILQEKCDKLQGERDSVCLRVTAIITALLQWSCSELRWDQALFGILQTILQPMVTLPALSEEVDVAAISAICLFCTRDAATARMHWSLFLQLVRNLREGSGSQRLIRARATVAARTLADCARLHGDGGVLDRDEVLGAALSLAAVPFQARQIVLEPLCGWLLSLGHVFFEEHLLEPVLEVQWALGWMLVETFRQRGKSSENADAPTKAEGEDEAEEEMEVDEIDTSTAMQLTQFFSLLPKLPGKQGAPMLSLAVESVAESGLWRQAVLQPHADGFHTRFKRLFSWPQLFAFAHERLPAEMRFRLWRCSLQLCVLSPTLAPLAEVPTALGNAIAAGQAPPGAAELVQEALRLGADADSLGALAQRLPPVADGQKGKWLLARPEAEAAEKARREDLVNIGICDLEKWAPASVEVPEVLPAHLRMRQVQRRGGRPPKMQGQQQQALQQAAAAVTGNSSLVAAVATPQRQVAGAVPETPPCTPKAKVPCEETDAEEMPPPKQDGRKRKGGKQAAQQTEMPPPAVPAPDAKRRRVRAKGQEAEAGKPQLPISALGA